MTEREHKPYHERRVDQQILDALLRIEERINRHWGTPEAPVETVEDRGNYEDRHTPDTTKPKGKRR